MHHKYLHSNRNGLAVILITISLVITLVTQGYAEIDDCNKVEQDYIREYMMKPVNDTIDLSLKISKGDTDLYVYTYQPDFSSMADWPDDDLGRSTNSGTETESVSINCWTGDIYIYVHGRAPESDYCLMSDTSPCEDPEPDVLDDCDDVTENKAWYYRMDNLVNNKVDLTLTTSTGNADLYVYANAINSPDLNLPDDELGKSTNEGTGNDSVSIDCISGSIHIYVKGYMDSDYCLKSGTSPCDDFTNDTDGVSDPPVANSPAPGTSDGGGGCFLMTLY